MISQASISKGVLFKYFGDKDGLFAYVVGYYFDLLETRLGKPDEPSELFAYIARSVLAENEICRSDSDMRRFYHLLNRIDSHRDHPAYARALARWGELQRRNLDACCARVDRERLRPGLETADARNALSIFFSGIKAWLRSDPDRILREPERFDAELARQIGILEAGLYGDAEGNDNAL